MEKIVKQVMSRLQREIMAFIQMGCGADLKTCLSRAEQHLISQLKPMMS
jgi:hypothetical protein